MLFLLFIFALLNLCFGDCPDGLVASFTNQNDCYLFVSNKSEFITAEGFCRQNGGHLTSVSNAFDNMFLSQEASTSFQDSTESDFWIGGTNQLIPGKWTWLDSTPFTYSDWDKGQPENVSSSNCIAASITNAFWSAEDCFKSKPFVCLIPAVSEATTTLKPLQCGKDWIYYEVTNFCYKIYSNLNITWQASEDVCVKDNSHLASIHSANEAVFIADLARKSIASREDIGCFYNQCWIGLYTLTNNTSWLWTDGTSFSYHGWAPEEPNNPGIENCSQLLLSNCDVGNSSNLFNNVLCNYTLQAFACKKNTFTPLLK